MGILAWIVMGGLAGWVASLIMSKSGSFGIVGNIIIGIIGAFIGGFIMELIGGNLDVMKFNVESFLVATGGAIVLLAVIGLFKKGKAE
jgi:uncharacterized membrane protein YeaQ/YmgE (transglycosylase-associated protein family)